MSFIDNNEFAKANEILSDISDLISGKLTIEQSEWREYRRKLRETSKQRNLELSLKNKALYGKEGTGISKEYDFYCRLCRREWTSDNVREAKLYKDYNEINNDHRWCKFIHEYSKNKYIVGLDGKKYYIQDGKVIVSSNTIDENKTDYSPIVEGRSYNDTISSKVSQNDEYFSIPSDELHLVACGCCSGPLMDRRTRLNQVYELKNEYELAKELRKKHRHRQVAESSANVVIHKNLDKYYQNWEQFEPDSDSEEDVPILPSSDPNFKALQADMDKRAESNKQKRNIIFKLKESIYQLLDSGRICEAKEKVEEALQISPGDQSILLLAVKQNLALFELDQAESRSSRILEISEVFDDRFDGNKARLNSETFLLSGITKILKCNNNLTDFIKAWELNKSNLKPIIYAQHVLRIYNLLDILPSPNISQKEETDLTFSQLYLNFSSYISTWPSDNNLIKLTQEILQFQQPTNKSNVIYSESCNITDIIRNINNGITSDKHINDIKSYFSNISNKGIKQLRYILDNIYELNTEEINKSIQKAINVIIITSILSLNTVHNLQTAFSLLQNITEHFSTLELYICLSKLISYTSITPITNLIIDSRIKLFYYRDSQLTNYKNIERILNYINLSKNSYDSYLMVFSLTKFFLTSNDSEKIKKAHNLAAIKYFNNISTDYSNEIDITKYMEWKNDITLFIGTPYNQLCSSILAKSFILQNLDFMTKNQFLILLDIICKSELKVGNICEIIYNCFRIQHNKAQKDNIINSKFIATNPISPYSNKSYTSIEIPLCWYKRIEEPKIVSDVRSITDSEIFKSCNKIDSNDNSKSSLLLKSSKNNSKNEQITLPTNMLITTLQLENKSQNLYNELIQFGAKEDLSVWLYYVQNLRLYKAIPISGILEFYLPTLLKPSTIISYKGIELFCLGITIKALYSILPFEPFYSFIFSKAFILKLIETIQAEEWYNFANYCILASNLLGTLEKVLSSCKKEEFSSKAIPPFFKKSISEQVKHFNLISNINKDTLNEQYKTTKNLLLTRYNKIRNNNGLSSIDIKDIEIPNYLIPQLKNLTNYNSNSYNEYLLENSNSTPLSDNINAEKCRQLETENLNKLKLVCRETINDLFIIMQTVKPFDYVWKGPKGVVSEGKCPQEIYKYDAQNSFGNLLLTLFSISKQLDINIDCLPWTKNLVSAHRLAPQTNFTKPAASLILRDPTSQEWIKQNGGISSLLQQK